ncbi:MAG: Unknown protein [uncultured Sulfurovum sp.]|uniref:Lipoprotein n=1 Tax=uncultured Sulfurovum sp. TaxID=269237 RepID=A0A6S6T2E5_9BACT|nr:MAG: Unknown protein [uncultured Sulfurovum sp.]
MLYNNKKIKKDFCNLNLLLLGIILLFFTACEEEFAQKGVLGVEAESIPSCDEQGNTSAMKISDTIKIAKQDNNTIVRVWHYQDSTKLICVLKGEAVIIK